METTTRHIRLPIDLIEAAKAQAAIEDRTMASLIRLAVAAYIAEQQARTRKTVA